MAEGTAADAATTDGTQTDGAADAAAQAAADAAATAADGKVDRAEMDKVIGERQAAKEASRKVAADLAAANVRLESMPAAEEMTAFGEWKEAQAKAAADKAAASGNADAIAENARKPLVAENKGLKEENAALRGQLSHMIRDKGLMDAAIANGAVNPGDVVGLLSGRVKMTVGADGKMSAQYLNDDSLPAFDSDGPITDPDKFVADFLKTRTYLVKATRAAGSGAAKAGGGTQTTAEATLEAFRNMTPDERQAKLATMTDAERIAILPSRRSEHSPERHL